MILLRFVQGVGVGGEWGGSVLPAMEWAKTNAHRGFIASWPQFGAPAGLFLANIAVLFFSWLSGDQFLSWAWRIPFLLSLIMVGIGLRIRLGIFETPVSAGILAEERTARASDRGLQASAQGGHSDRTGADGGAGAWLHV